MSERFAVGGKVKFAGDNFKAWFYGKAEKCAPRTKLRYSELTRSGLDDEIRKEIGVEFEETTLAQIDALMERQSSGQPGVLLTNGFANIFYVRDVNGELRAVYVRWDAFCGGWHVLANSVGNPRRWRGGYRVFSSNS